ncbi:unnamed protein product, partial [Ascophyllum nodosum]
MGCGSYFYLDVQTLSQSWVSLQHIHIDRDRPFVSWRKTKTRFSWRLFGSSTLPSTGQACLP